MSSRKLQEDTRRLVGMRDDQGGLDDAKERTTIGPITRVTPINADGTGGGMSTESGEEATSDGSGGTGAGDQAGSPTDPGGFDQPGVDVEFAEDEVKDNPPNVNDLFDGIVDVSWGSGEIFTGVDCDTGDCVVINTSGQFAPPPGWESPDFGPSDPDYVPGFYQRWNVPRPGETSTVMAFQSSAAMVAYMTENFGEASGEPGFYGASGVMYLHQGTTTCPFVCSGVWVASGPASGPFICGGQGIARCIPANRVTASRWAQMVSCAKSPDPVCGLPEPAPAQWPSDNCTQLTQIDGRWQMHPNEPDRITAYEQGASLLNDICSGSRRYQVLPGVDGGVVLWNYKDNVFRYKNPQTGNISFGSSSALLGVVDRGFRVEGGSANPYIKPAGFED